MTSLSNTSHCEYLHSGKWGCGADRRKVGLKKRDHSTLKITLGEVGSFHSERRMERRMERFTVGYRELNTANKMDAYSMLNPKDIFNRMGGSQIFSILDCASAYWSIPVRDEDKKYTALVSTIGHCEFNWMLCHLISADGRLSLTTALLRIEQYQIPSNKWNIRQFMGPNKLVPGLCPICGWPSRAFTPTDPKGGSVGVVGWLRGQFYRSERPLDLEIQNSCVSHAEPTVSHGSRRFK